MSKLLVRIGGLLCLALLSGCLGENSPQDVTIAFWKSVITKDVEGAVEHSTLIDARSYDGFSRDWKGLQPTLGKVVIDGDEASVVTTLSHPGDTTDRPVDVVTYLVRQDDQWKVDSVRTGDELSGPLSTLFARLNRLGEALSERLQGDTAVEMDRLGAQLEQLSDTVGERAAETFDKYGEELRRSIDELAESVERALENERLSEQDRRVLREVVDNLNDGSDKLSRPTVRSIADGGRSVATARQQLETVDDRSIAPYQEQWQEWSERIEADLRRMVDELAATSAQRPESTVRML